jgi:hypothetical protein
MNQKIHKSSEVSDEAAKAKTGNFRKEWILLLDSIEAYKSQQQRDLLWVAISVTHWAG